MYGIKIEAVNSVGESAFSDPSYYICANVPVAPSAPTLEGSQKSTITIAWNALTGIANTGGTPITGYRVYLNDLLSDTWKLVYDGSNYPSTLTY